MIETRQARYFIAVAEELHFGRAAERLHMTQPPLSQAIRQLERDLGANLFERTSRSVVLTETGRLFLAHCYRVVHAAEQAERAVGHAQAGQLGSLAVGAVAAAFSGPVRRLLEDFRTACPDIEVRVDEVNTNDGVQALLDFKLDVAIVRYTGTDERLHAVPMRSDHFVAALPSAHRLAGDARDDAAALDLRELADEAWVWIPRPVSPGYHDVLVMGCQQAGFSPDVRHRAQSIQSQLLMVACGIGVALVPDTAVVPVDNVTYVPLTAPVPAMDLSLVRRAGTPEPLVARFSACALSPHHFGADDEGTEVRTAGAREPGGAGS